MRAKPILIGLALSGVMGCPGSGSAPIPVPAPGAAPVRYQPTAAGSNGTFQFDIVCEHEGNLATASALISWHDGPGAPSCPEVTYIQIVRTTDAHGHEAAQTKQRDRLTADGWSVDKLDSHLGGGVWYPVDQSGAYDPQLGGPGKTGTGDFSHIADNIQAGGTHWPITYEYITCAVCKSGANLGKVLDCVYWTFKVNGDGSVTSPQASPPSDAQKTSFREAIDKWNAQAATSGGTQPAAPTLIW